MSDRSFTKQSRLLSSSDYKTVFDNASIKVSNKHCLMLACSCLHTMPRVGLVIAKKNVRLAVQRNRVKRIIRETFRHRQHELAPIDIVVLVRKGIDELSNEELHQSFHGLWSRIRRKAQQ